MNFAEIKKYDIANGPGVRLSLFVSGCTHHCPGCFNKETWDFDFGTPYTKDTEDEIIRELKKSCYQGLTFLGGEPLEPVNQNALLPLARRFKHTYPEKDLWCFTGYRYDRDIIGVMADKIPETKELLNYIDVLVDGEFILNKKDITLLFKGSSNQRTIDVPASLIEGHLVLWDPKGASISKSTKI